MSKGSKAPPVKRAVGVLSGSGRGPEPPPTAFQGHYSGDDLVRILSRLTLDVERFDSIIQAQRLWLEKQGAEKWTPDDALARRRSKRIRAGAAEVMTRALSALEELHGFGYPGERQHNGG